MVVKCARLMPTLEFGEYMLIMHERPSMEYNVLKGPEIIGRIHVNMDIVNANTGTEILNIVYGVKVTILDGPEDMPIELFERVIMATIIMS